MEWEEQQLDVLSILERTVDRFIGALEAQEDQSEYVEGQLAYLHAVGREAGGASASAKPSEVLERVAGKLGIRMADGGLDQLPANQREAGILSMWSLCLGLVEGVAIGAQEAMGAIGEISGVDTRFDVT